MLLTIEIYNLCYIESEAGRRKRNRVKAQKLDFIKKAVWKRDSVSFTRFRFRFQNGKQTSDEASVQPTCEITCFASPSTQNFTTKATKSLMTTDHELQCLNDLYKAWNQNLNFLDEFEERVKEIFPLQPSSWARRYHSFLNKDQQVYPNSMLLQLHSYCGAINFQVQCQALFFLLSLHRIILLTYKTLRPVMTQRD
ncbi:hypothetical protein YC2023_051224 [Brassica napus]